MTSTGSYVYGVDAEADITSATGTGNIYGVAATVTHAGTSGSLFGLRSYNHGSTAGTSYGVYTMNYSDPLDTGSLYGVYAYVDNDTTGDRRAVYAYKVGGGDYAGYFSGDLHITGALTKGSGSFVQPHKSDPTKEIVYNFLEGPEHAAFIRGTAFLEGGRAVIEMPEHWQQVAAAEGITVHLTPVGAWAPLYAASISAREVVIESAPGFGNDDVEFSYYILSKRDGFQAHEPIQKNKHFTPDGESAWMFENRWSDDTLTNVAIREMLVSNGTLNEDLTLNKETAARFGWKIVPNEEDPSYCGEFNLPCADPGRADHERMVERQRDDRKSGAQQRAQERAQRRAEKRAAPQTDPADYEFDSYDEQSRSE